MKIVLLLLLTSLVSWSRTWTSTTGSTVEAELIKYDGETVQLKLDSGKTLSLNLSQLSLADQTFLQKKDEPPEDLETRMQRAVRDFANWDAEWPNSVKVSQDDFSMETYKEDEANDRYIYHSDHFEFICDVKLSKTLVKKFAWYFEATHAYVKSLPLSMGRTQEEIRHKILLFESKNDYYKNGGTPNSAGVFLGQRDVVLVPLQSVGVKKVGSSYRIDYDEDNKTLSHEIVHKLTDNAYFQKGAWGWFSEGLAEFVGLTPYRSGIYQISRNLKPINKYVSAYGIDGNGGRALGEKIEVPHLADFMMQTYNEFMGDAQINYGVSCLIITYFIKLGGEGEQKNLQNFLKALKLQKRGEAPTAAHKALLNGRTYDQLEEDITKKWKSRGITLKFE